MKYVSWASFYEGPSDALYLDVLLPRMIRDLVAQRGVDVVEVPDAPAVRLGERGRAIENVAEEACEFSNAYEVVFIHADTGGRALEQGLDNRAQAYCEAFNARCEWPLNRCLTITPRHETEAWLLADGQAVAATLGYTGNPTEIGLPATAKAAEKLGDPKLTLANAMKEVRGRRRNYEIANLFPAIAQRQRLDMLRGSQSFASFEGRLSACLIALGCIR